MKKQLDSNFVYAIVLGIDEKNKNLRVHLKINEFVDKVEKKLEKLSSEAFKASQKALPLF